MTAYEKAKLMAYSASAVTAGLVMMGTCAWVLGSLKVTSKVLGLEDGKVKQKSYY